MTDTHGKVADSTGVLQQPLKGHGPAQHTVGWTRLTTWSAREAGAAACTASGRHVQLYTQTHPTDQNIIAWLRTRLEPHKFLQTCNNMFQWRRCKESLTSIRNGLALRRQSYRDTLEGEKTTAKLSIWFNELQKRNELAARTAHTHLNNWTAASKFCSSVVKSATTGSGCDTDEWLSQFVKLLKSSFTLWYLLPLIYENYLATNTWWHPRVHVRSMGLCFPLTPQVCGFKFFFFKSAEH